MLNVVGLAIALLFLFFSSYSFTEHQKLIITASSSWVPFSYINSEGEPEGMIVDFWRLYAEENQLNLEFHLLPMDESLDYVKKHANVIHGGLGYSQSRADDLVFSYELPTSYFQASLFARSKKKLANPYTFENNMVGVVKNSIKQEFLSFRVGNKNIKEFLSFAALKEAVIRGELDYFINDHNSSLFIMEAMGKEGAFIPQKRLYSFPLHFAVNKESANLVALLEKGIENIPPNAINAINQKWQPKNLGVHQHLIELEILVVLTMSLLGSTLFFCHRKLILCTKKLNLTLSELKDSSKKLKNIEETDALTGAKTRRQFFEELESKRFSNNPYVIAVLGINKLKMINEKYGQDIGDMVLKHLTYQLKWQLSDTFYARLCGGEFAILFEGIERKEAETRLNQLYKNLILNPLYIDQQIIPIELSSGITEYPYDDKQAEVLVRIAAMRMRLSRESSKQKKTAYYTDPTK